MTRGAMDSTRLKLWKAKLRTARVEERQWIKVNNRSVRAMARVGRQIDELERKIANELAKAKQRAGAAK